MEASLEHIGRLNNEGVKEVKKNTDSLLERNIKTAK